MGAITKQIVVKLIVTMWRLVHAPAVIMERVQVPIIVHVTRLVMKNVMPV